MITSTYANDFTLGDMGSEALFYPAGFIAALPFIWLGGRLAGLSVAWTFGAFGVGLVGSLLVGLVPLSLMPEWLGFTAYGAFFSAFVSALISAAVLVVVVVARSKHGSVA